MSLQSWQETLISAQGDGPQLLNNTTATSIIPPAAQAIPLNVVAKTQLPFYMQVILTCRSIGAGTTATLMAIGFFISETYVGSPVPATGGAGAIIVPNTAPAVGTGFDSTAANTVDIFGTFSVNTATTQITLNQYLLEALN